MILALGWSPIVPSFVLVRPVVLEELKHTQTDRIVFYSKDLFAFRFHVLKTVSLRFVIHLLPLPQYKAVFLNLFGARTP